MRKLVKVTRTSLLILGMSVLASSVQASKKVSREEQVAVLLKWYRTYFEEGKYKQAEQVAQLAYELAPDDPEITVALKLARRQQASNSSTAEVEAQLAKLLQKMERVERQLRDTATKNRRRAIIQIAKEPPGSPDAN